jgi:hypothetical protein
MTTRGRGGSGIPIFTLTPAREAAVAPSKMAESNNSFFIRKIRRGGVDAYLIFTEIFPHFSAF